MTRSEHEIKTVKIMIGMYCRGHHGSRKTLCEECRNLFSYAEQRTLQCRFGEEKPACGRCPIHCYKPQMKEKIGRVMRFAGPRMIYCHPILAIRHLIAARAVR
jgi:hypothetical protein